MKRIVVDGRLASSSLLRMTSQNCSFKYFHPYYAMIFVCFVFFSSILCYDNYLFNPYYVMLIIFSSMLCHVYYFYQPKIQRAMKSNVCNKLPELYQAPVSFFRDIT